MSLTCRCFGDHEHTHCPGGLINTTCEAVGDCYIKITTVSDEHYELRMGCLPADSTWQCHERLNYTSEFSSVDNIHYECCDPKLKGSMCNDPEVNEQLKLIIPEFAPPAQPKLAIIVSLCVVITCTFSVVLYIVYRNKKHKKREDHDRTRDTETTEAHSLLPFTSPNESVGITSGSGAGPTQLSVRTIAKQVEQGVKLGQGRYGSVFKSTYNVETVAKKIYLAEWEECWKNEWQLFQRVNLRDERIVGFIAHDVEYRDDQVNRIIIMDYMEHGSLQQYLAKQQLTQAQAIRLLGSLVQGIMFLHTEVRGTEQIASVVHRDLSSTSVLVNADGQCCISDFGMALSRSTRRNERAEYTIVKRCQTPLYSPPEYVYAMYSPTPKDIDFEELMAGDIYSASLLFWEIINRVHDSHYTLALSPEISEHLGVTSYSAITYEVISRVHQHQLRPASPLHHDWPPQLRIILAESWCSRWQDRLTALRIFYNLKKLFPSIAHSV